MCSASMPSLLLVAAVGSELPALAENDYRVGSVPGFDNVETLFDLALEVPVTEVPADSVESHLSSFSVLRGFTATIGSSVAVAGTPICRGVDPAGVGTSTSRCKSRSSAV